ADSPRIEEELRSPGRAGPSSSVGQSRVEQDQAGPTLLVGLAVHQHRQEGFARLGPGGEFGQVGNTDRREQDPDRTVAWSSGRTAPDRRRERNPGLLCPRIVPEDDRAVDVAERAGGTRLTLGQVTPKAV